ncbi:hypothetical protein AMTR_s00010p00157530 [Amborella trichopoda]|uniref:Uncharacterized protein n=1 Tax=Amborella trichopoda TaxID=13333 RepID=W1NG48_AMBTC|nr:hypothetical protein AMTR_s00010p00157530 [Amborella trichopoda]
MSLNGRFQLGKVQRGLVSSITMAAPHGIGSEAILIIELVRISSCRDLGEVNARVRLHLTNFQAVSFVYPKSILGDLLAYTSAFAIGVSLSLYEHVNLVWIWIDENAHLLVRGGSKINQFFYSYDTHINEVLYSMSSSVRS